MASKTVNQKIRDASLRHAEYLEKLSKSEAAKLARFLTKDVVPSLQDKLQRAIGNKNKVAKKRINEMLAEIKALVEKSYDVAGKSTSSRLSDVAEREAQWQKDMVQSSLPIDYSFRAPSVDMLRDLPRVAPVQGAFVADWFEKLKAQTVFDINRNIKIGIAAGESIDAITSRLVGTAKNDYKDGVVSVAERHVKTIVRTSINDISAAAREEAFKANEDIISGVQIVATLDDRTTEICQNQDGKVYPVNEGPRPPFHYNCRTTVIPVVKSWEEMGFKGLKELSPSTRASMDGQVASTLTYKEWQAQRGTTPEVLNKQLMSSKMLLDRMPIVGNNKQVASKLTDALTNEISTNKRFSEAITSVRAIPTVEARPLQGAICGEFYRNGNKIHINEKLFKVAKLDSKLTYGSWSSDPSITGTLRHEFGHYVFENSKAPGKLIDSLTVFNDLTKKELNKVSKYASTNNHELFAEAFCAYTHKDYKKGQLPDSVERLVKSVIDGKKWIDK